MDHFVKNECVAEFQFQKDDVYTSPGVLQIPDEVRYYNGTKVSDIEALCIFHAFPLRYLDLIHRFARLIRELWIINNFVLKFILKDGKLFTTRNRQLYLQTISKYLLLFMTKVPP